MLKTYLYVNMTRGREAESAGGPKRAGPVRRCGRRAQPPHRTSLDRQVELRIVHVWGGPRGPRQSARDLTEGAARDLANGRVAGPSIRSQVPTGRAERAHGSVGRRRKPAAHPTDERVRLLRAARGWARSARTGRARGPGNLRPPREDRADRSSSVARHGSGRPGPGTSFRSRVGGLGHHPPPTASEGPRTELRAPPAAKPRSSGIEWAERMRFEWLLLR